MLYPPPPVLLLNINVCSKDSEDVIPVDQHHPWRHGHELTSLGTVQPPYIEVSWREEASPQPAHSLAPLRQPQTRLCLSPPLPAHGGLFTSMPGPLSSGGSTASSGYQKRAAAIIGSPAAASSWTDIQGLSVEEEESNLSPTDLSIRRRRLTLEP